jgi:protein-tyrosine phosphatase
MELAPIEDGGVPTDFELFRINVKRWASALRVGNNMLVHCGAGIGRIGMVASCIVVASGIAPARVLEFVNAAGSCPETPQQHALIYKLADVIVDRQR